MFSKIFKAINNLTATTDRSIRPYIIVDILPRRSINMLFFRIKNVGKTPAYQITVTPETELVFGKKKTTDLLIFNYPISAIGPGEEISFYYDNAIELFARDNVQFDFPVKVKYADITQRYFEEKMVINTEIYKGLSIDLSPEEIALKEIQRIQYSIEKLYQTIKLAVKDNLE